MADLARLSLNQATVQNWNVGQVVDGCVRHGIGSVSLWRHKIAETGLAECARLVQGAGLHVSSVCRGGMFVAPTAEERRERIADNFRAVEEAAALKADSLVIVVGASPQVPIADARTMVADGLAELVPYARNLGVRIGLEPLHPMYAGDRSVLNTIDQALAMAAPFAAEEVGVVLDTFHFWWDPRAYPQIESAAGRIFGFHVCDWLTPMPDMLLGRGIMGDGCIDNHGFRNAVEAAGYHGPIEVEVFNQTIWDTDGDEVLAKVVQRFTELV